MHTTSTQNTHQDTQHNTTSTQYTQYDFSVVSGCEHSVSLLVLRPHTESFSLLLLCLLLCLLSCCCYLGGGGEPAAEGVEDAEAVVQSERFSVFTEEVDQLAAFFLQLLPTAAQRAQRRGGMLTTHERTMFSLKQQLK